MFNPGNSQTPAAFSDGATAFQLGKSCPYTAGQCCYWHWWQGWQHAAQKYLDEALDRLYGLAEQIEETS